MRGVHEHPHAADADKGDEPKSEGAKDEARVLDGDGQSEDAHANVTL